MSGTNITNNNTLITYRVVGRYMTGSTVTGYHLVGSDGRQLPLTKERVIYFIGKGLVENMRVQANGSELIIRGKGINLNSLPIYDEKKNDYRNNTASQNVKNTSVAPKKSSGVSAMGQLKIVKRIMYKTSCLGYMVEDHSGHTMKLSRDKVIELAIKRIISNATVQKYNVKGEDKPRLILRGADCDLGSLPVLLVDAKGKIVDPNDKSKMTARATRIKRGGIVHDTIANKKIPFEAGDYLVCGVKGAIKVVKAEDMPKKFKVDKLVKDAICDNYLENVSKYPIELFGSRAQALSASQVATWIVVRPIGC